MSTSYDSSTVIIELGQRVYCGLYGGQCGTVFEIHGAQHPNAVKSFGGGLMVTGGSAKFDIVFDNGSMSYRVPESIVRGDQWRIYGVVANADQIAEFLANAASVKANKSARDAVAKQREIEELARLVVAEEYKHLQQGNDEYGGKLAAVNIRAELKRAFPGVKFSVRKVNYGSLSIGWKDGPTEAQVEAITDKYETGHFNGMEDIYEYNTGPWHEVFGGAKYIRTNRDESSALVVKAIQAVYQQYSGNLVDIPMPAPEDYKGGQLYRINVPGINEDLQRLISQTLRDMT